MIDYFGQNVLIISPSKSRNINSHKHKKRFLDKYENIYFTSFSVLEIKSNIHFTVFYTFGQDLKFEIKNGSKEHLSE